MARKKSRGRQKVEMMKMQNESNLQVTFSKRRAGLFKKANELCTLTGAQVALVVFSPGKKAFSFGSPDVDSIIAKYEGETKSPVPKIPTNHLLQIQRKLTLDKHNKELNYLEMQLEFEKKRGERLNKMLEIGAKKHWWEAPIRDLNLEQLEQLKTALEELHNNINVEVEKFTTRANELHEHYSYNFLANFGADANPNPCGIGHDDHDHDHDHVPYNARAIGPSNFVPFDPVRALANNGNFSLYAAGPSRDNSSFTIGASSSNATRVRFTPRAHGVDGFNLPFGQFSHGHGR